MTKEQFLEKWGWQAPPENITADLDAVIATEIEKAKEAKLKPTDQVTDQEPEQVAELTAQPSSKVKLDNSFDRDRFERIFCAIVASGKTETWEQDFKGTIKTIEKLDAYYASKEGGNNE